MTENPLEYRFQKRLIEEGEWDFLIVLDACRYDFLERVYHEYLDGRISKVISSGTCTTEWLDNTFDRKFEDVIYVSGNPFINSKGIGKSKGNKIFGEVIDVWDEGWNEKIGTTPPISMNKKAIEMDQKYPNKKIMVHYVQPHTPYLSFQKEINYLEESLSTLEKLDFLLTKIRTWFYNKLNEKINPGSRKRMKLSKVLKPCPKSMKIPLCIGGRNYLWQVYEKNLKMALEKVSELSEQLTGRIVVTSDHGELLGEGGVYGHVSGHPSLREVPWLEITKE